MKNNPVYKREMLVRSRSFRIPLIIMIFNGILAVVALLNMYQSIAQVKVSGSVRYENFLQLYAFVAALEFMLLMFIMPALTSCQHQRGAGSGTHWNSCLPRRSVLWRLLSGSSCPRSPSL